MGTVAADTVTDAADTHLALVADTQDAAVTLAVHAVALVAEEPVAGMPVAEPVADMLVAAHAVGLAAAAAAEPVVALAAAAVAGPAVAAAAMAVAADTGNTSVSAV